MSNTCSISVGVSNTGTLPKMRCPCFLEKKNERITEGLLNEYTSKKIKFPRFVNVCQNSKDYAMPKMKATYWNACDKLKLFLAKWTKVCNCSPVVYAYKTEPENKMDKGS